MQVCGRVRSRGIPKSVMLNLLMLIFFHFLSECFEIFTICGQPPVLQTDANGGMIKIVVRETEACKLSGP